MELNFQSFQPDEKVPKIAEAWSLDAVDYARKTFKITLDWSDHSIQQVEKMLTELHNQMANAQPSEEIIWKFAKMLGSYVGEVFRKNHGATWGTVALNQEPMAALQTTRNPLCFWPWVRVRDRLVRGPEFNVWHYYHSAVREDGGTITPQKTQFSFKKKKSFWQRLFGG